MNRRTMTLALLVALWPLADCGDAAARPPAWEAEVPATTPAAWPAPDPESAAPRTVRSDTLFLFPSSGPGAYGSPGTDARGFTFDGPGGEPEPAGWFPFSHYEADEDRWHVADTAISAGTGTDMGRALPFDPGDPNNDYSLWCGRENICSAAGGVGYGNGWDQYAVVDLAGHTVTSGLEISYAYRADFEGGVWDFFQVMVEVDGAWREVLLNDESAERTYLEPTILLDLEDLGGLPTQTRVAFRFSSDGAWSDEDGLFPTWVGAVWLDNIRIGVDGAEVFASDFEDGEAPAGLSFESLPGIASNAALYRDLHQSDPEMEDLTYCWAFFQEGHTNPDYPIPVIPYGPPYVYDCVQSPRCDVDASGEPFAWRDGDQLLIGGWAYMDFPATSLLSVTVEVAALVAEGNCLMAFDDSHIIFFPQEEIQWATDPRDMTEALLRSARGGTIIGAAARLGVIDMAGVWCDFPGCGFPHTPAPYYDNLRLMIIRDVPTAVEEAPPATALLGAHPNPFNPATTIRFSLAEPGRVRLAVCDVAGRAVRSLVDGPLAAGEHAAVWDGRDERGAAMSSGVYLVDFRAGESRERGKLLLIK